MQTRALKCNQNGVEQNERRLPALQEDKLSDILKMYHSLLKAKKVLEGLSHEAMDVENMPECDSDAACKD